MSRTYKSVDVDVEIELEDVLEFIDGCNEKEMASIKSRLKVVETPISNKFRTLEDELKLDILTEAAKKYSLVQLEEMLGIKQPSSNKNQTTISL